MSKKLLFLLFCLFVCCTTIHAQDVQKSELQKEAEAVDPKQDIAKARSLFIKAYKDYAANGQIKQAVECGVKGAAFYYKDSFYKEAFELLRGIEAHIAGARNMTEAEKSALYYKTTSERLQMYMRLHKPDKAKEQLARLEQLANQTNDESVKNEHLYNKANYHYTFGQIAQGNAVFSEMAKKLTASKEYDKVDEVYKMLISNAKASNNATYVAQSYSNYIAWKDSANALKHADEINALKKQIADHEETIADKDSSLTARWATIIGLGILAAILAAALIFGAMVLMRYMVLTRKQKKTIKLANESNALKAKFISNISSQLEPTLNKLDNSTPEVKALLDFSKHIQTLSDLENSTEEVEKTETPIQQFTEDIAAQVREKNPGINLTVNAPKMNVAINKEYVSHILLHLLGNAIEHTPEGGSVSLDFKKRSPRTYQYLVTNPGEPMPEEQREDLFKPFREVRDLTTGDGLGLPICKQMALKMNGDLDVDPTFTKGTRFTLELHT